MALDVGVSLLNTSQFVAISSKWYVNIGPLCYVSHYQLPTYTLYNYMYRIFSGGSRILTGPSFLYGVGSSILTRNRKNDKNDVVMQRRKQDCDVIREGQQNGPITVARFRPAYRKVSTKSNLSNSRLTWLQSWLASFDILPGSTTVGVFRTFIKYPEQHH